MSFVVLQYADSEMFNKTSSRSKEKPDESKYYKEHHSCRTSSIAVIKDPTFQNLTLILCVSELAVHARYYTFFKVDDETSPSIPLSILTKWNIPFIL